MMLRAILLLGICLLATPGHTQQGSAPQEREAPANGQRVAAVPELSVRTLFHPDDRFDYFRSSPPATHWAADSRLAIRSEDAWRVWDPRSGELGAWDLPARIRAELESISGLSTAAIDVAVRAAAEQIPHLDAPVMLEVGGGLAVIGGDRAARLVTRDARSWQTPELSPDGSAVAFVRESDLYVVRVESGEILRLTHDGSPTRLNGRLDWTYQEEIYGRGNFKGFWWSPDSRQIALLRIDISGVLPYTVTGSETPRGTVEVTPYPKSGDPIPRAGLWVVAIDSLQLTPIHQPQGDEAETLVVRVTWRPDGKRLTYQIQNRIQTWLELRQADTTATARQVLLREQGPAWIEILGEPHWLPAGDFLWLSDLPAGRRHLWKISKDGSRRTPVTSGDWDVRELVHVVPERSLAFVSGDRDRGVRGQQLYLVDWSPAAQHESGGPEADAAQEKVVPLTSEPGWHSVDVSPDGHWFTDTFSTLTREPRKTLMSVADGVRLPLPVPGKDADEESSAPWETLDLPQPQWVDISSEDGVPLPAYIIPPRGVDTQDPEGRFPVLIYTYGGPQAPAAVDRWNGRNGLYHQFLATQGIGVLVVDNRSSGGRGIADTWSIHRRMGVQELADLLDAVAWLKGQPWVDGRRLAMRGWSFGGYYTAYAMTHSDAFAAGIAGGSVTDWRNYDAFYTERYMDTPQNNEAGYRETSVTAKAGELTGRLLLIHGEVDDNVHLGNTLQLVAALQRAGKQFDLMIYPGAAHGVAESRQLYHLYELMTEFLRRELGTATPALPSSPVAAVRKPARGEEYTGRSPSAASP